MELDISLPITENSLHCIFQYFWDEESSLSELMEEGICVDEEYLKNITNAVSELVRANSKNTDLAYINEKLSSLSKLI